MGGTTAWRAHTATHNACYGLLAAGRQKQRPSLLAHVPLTLLLPCRPLLSPAPAIHATAASAASEQGHGATGPAPTSLCCAAAAPPCMARGTCLPCLTTWLPPTPAPPPQVVESHAVLSQWGRHVRVLIVDPDEFFVPATSRDTLARMRGPGGCLAPLREECVMVTRRDIFPHQVRRPRGTRGAPPVSLVSRRPCPWVGGDGPRPGAPTSPALACMPTPVACACGGTAAWAGAHQLWDTAAPRYCLGAPPFGCCQPPRSIRLSRPRTRRAGGWAASSRCGGTASPPTRPTRPSCC